MHITNQKFIFYKYMVGNWQNIFMEHGLYLISQLFFAEKSKMLTDTMYFWLLL